MLPSQFKPQSAAEFFGPARAEAEFITNFVRTALPDGSPVTLLILGKPGIGKSQLAEHFVRCTGSDKWSITKYNGTQIKIEIADQIGHQFRSTNLFGGYRVVQIEEVDKMPTIAQVRFLTLLDDLPKHTAVVCTSNCKVTELEERFQTRFTVLHIKPPTNDDIMKFLVSRFDLSHAEPSLRMASLAWGGNVRAALKDADEISIRCAPQRLAA